jgi:hypothetical protein
MSMEFIQRIVIDGPAEDVERLERSLVRTEERVERRKKVKERIPFSFAAIYELLDEREEPPNDPYDLSEFRRRPTDPGYAEKRYTFRTYNITAVEFLTPLSRIFPRLTFRVGLMCEGQIEHYLIRRGRNRIHIVPDERVERQYHRYAKREGMTLEEMQEQFCPLSDAEWEVFNETFDYWGKVAPRRRLPKRRQSWDAATVVRGD